MSSLQKLLRLPISSKLVACFSLASRQVNIQYIGGNQCKNISGVQKQVPLPSDCKHNTIPIHTIPNPKLFKNKCRYHLTVNTIQFLSIQFPTQNFPSPKLLPHQTTHMTHYSLFCPHLYLFPFVFIFVSICICICVSCSCRRI